MLTRAHIDEVVRAALDEDAPWGDLTSETLIPADATATAELRAREAGVFSGGDVFASAFRLTDLRLEVTLLRAEGEAFTPGDVLALVSGPARGLLTAERVGLNFVQRMSGIATLTAAYVAARAICPTVADYAVVSHASAEPGYAPIMAALGQKPLLDLGLRLGEGTGAALALFLMRSACNIYNDMATFASAGVSEG